MAGGSSYELEIGTWQAVLRRPPLGPVAAKVALYLYRGNKENAASILINIFNRSNAYASGFGGRYSLFR